MGWRMSIDEGIAEGQRVADAVPQP
jgi:hypothetical protein